MWGTPPSSSFIPARFAYTRHDRACLLWATVTFAIFLTAQFAAVSWTQQAIAATILTLIGLAGMTRLTAYLTAEPRIAAVFYSWWGLMGLGIVLTDLALIYGWLPILINDCALWLGLTGVGYVVTAAGMKSRTFLICGLLHLGAIALLPWVGGWQALTTGFVIAGTVLLMAQFQWDSDGICLRLPQVPGVAAPGSLDRQVDWEC